MSNGKGKASAAKARQSTKKSAKTTKRKSAPRIGIGGVLGKLASKQSGAKKAAKSKHPVVELKRYADQFEEIAQIEARLKADKGRLTQLKAGMMDDLDAERRIQSRQANGHIRSIKFVGSAGAAPLTYTTKNQYTGANFSDEGVWADAVEAFVDAAEVDEEEAAEMLQDRFRTETTVKFKAGSLEDQRVIDIIQEHLADDVDIKTVSVPTEEFHNRSSFRPEERALMKSLTDGRIIKHYTPTLRPTSARS